MLDALNGLLATGELATLFTNDEMDGLLQVQLYISVCPICMCVHVHTYVAVLCSYVVL